MNRAELFYSTIANLYQSTPLRPLALGLTLCMGVVLLCLPKKYAVVPVPIVTLFITSLQRLVIASMDFSMYRILVVFGWVRVFLRHETASWRRTTLDSAMILFVLSEVAFYTLQRRTAFALLSSLGAAFDLIGLYFLFRILVPDQDGLIKAARVLSMLAVPIAMLMILEQLTARNLFSVFGGVPEFTYIREGRLRSQAAFQHPITAGTFGATLLPLMVGLFSTGKRQRILAILGVLSAIVITITSASSGPILALLAGIIALLLWRVSNDIAVIRFIIVMLIIGLQVFMKAPVYALIARVKIVGGSTAYYRYFLIDEFIKHFKDWWVSGVKSTAYWGEGLFDVTNQYIRIAVDGGLCTLLLFFLIIWTAYREIGAALHSLNGEEQGKKRFILWCLGATLFAHLVSFISVNYFDQMIVIWLLLLASTSSLGQDFLEKLQVRGSPYLQRQQII